MNNTNITLLNDNPQADYLWMPPITYSGPLEPDGHELTLTNNEYSVLIPRVFVSNAPRILSRIEQIAQLLRPWLNRPAHQPRVSIFFAPWHWEEFIKRQTWGFYIPNKGSIFLYGRFIFPVIDTLQDSTDVEYQGLRTLAHEMTHSYTPQITLLPDFLIEGIAEFGEYYCLLHLGYQTLANCHIKSSYIQSIDDHVWDWKWDGNDSKDRLYSQSFHILYRLTNITDVQIFQRFFAALEVDHIRFVGLAPSDKWRLFIHYLSKAAGQDLFPFFQQWGLQINSSEYTIIQASYGISFVVGVLFLAGPLWHRRVRQLISKKKRNKWVYAGIVVLYAIYLILPHILPRSAMFDNVAWGIMRLSYSLRGALIVMGLFCILIPFFLGFLSETHSIKDLRKR